MTDDGERRSAFCNSVVGADLSAAAAGDALVGVDVVDVAGGDCANGANRFTSAACDTVVADYVSHSSKVLKSLYCCFRVFVRIGGGVCSASGLDCKISRNPCDSQKERLICILSE